MPNPIITKIMTGDDTGQQLIKFAQEVAFDLQKADLKNTQVRTIFSEARKIELIWKSDKRSALRNLVMLKPKLVYQSKRKGELSRLKDVLIDAIDEVEKQPTDSLKDKAFEHFMDLFEAILAYHKAR